MKPIAWLAGAAALVVVAAIAPIVAFAAVASLGVMTVMTVVRRFFATAAAVTVVVIFAGFAMLIPGTWVVGPVGAVGTPAILVALAATMWWGLARVQPALGIDLGTQPIRVFVMIFGWASVAAFVAAFSRPLNPIEESAAWRDLIQLAGLCGLTLLVCDGLRTRKEVDTVVERIADFGAVIAVVGILQYFTSINLAIQLKPPGLTLNSELNSVLERGVLERVAGTAVHPVEFGAVMAALLPLAIHLAVNSTGRWWPWVRTGLVILAIPLSVSRTGIVVAGVGLLVLLSGWSWRRCLNFAVMTVPVVALVRIAAPGTLGTLRALFVFWQSDPSVTSRSDDYADMYEFFRERPVFGRGLGTLVPELYDFIDNQLLLALVTTGLVGLGALVLLCVGGATIARQVYHRGPTRQTRELGNTLAAVLLGLFAAFVTYDALGFPIHSALFFLILGVIGALWRMEVRDARGTDSGHESTARLSHR